MVMSQKYGLDISRRIVFHADWGDPSEKEKLIFLIVLLGRKTA
jgi:hypothetical protein